MNFLRFVVAVMVFSTLMRAPWNEFAQLAVMVGIMVGIVALVVGGVSLINTLREKNTPLRVGPRWQEWAKVR